MAKTVTAKIKLQCPGGQATPAPPVGPALGQHGVNIGQFVMQFNERTKEMKGTTIPVEITVYNDRSFEFITKSPPAAVLLKQAAGIASGSAEPHKTKVGTRHRGPGPQDRRDQVPGHERPRHRPRHAADRRHGAEHGGGGQGLSDPRRGLRRDRPAEAAGGCRPAPDRIADHRPVARPADRPARPARPPAGEALGGPRAGSPDRRDRDGQTEAAAFPNRRANVAKHSKRFRALLQQAPSGPAVAGARRSQALKKFGTTKFDQTVEVSTNLGIDPRQSDQNVRGSVALPHGIGKSVRVAVFAQGDNAEKAREAGADIVGADDLAAADQGRHHGLRRGPGHAGRHGDRRPAGPRARPARPDALAPLRAP